MISRILRRAAALSLGARRLLDGATGPDDGEHVSGRHREGVPERRARLGRRVGSPRSAPGLAGGR